MKKLILLITLTVILNPTNFYGQQAIFGGPSIVSPEIRNDNSVIFRLLAPKVDSVQITGDFLPTNKIQTPYGEMDVPGKANLTKDNEGIWSFETEPLNPELYNYTFIADGVITPDPSNPFLIRDVASITNIFIIGGGHSDLYKVTDIPHGTVARRWYDSPGLEKDRRLTIYTPPGYETSTETFPVLYLLHGAGGDEEAWIELGRTSQIMDNLINQGKALPMIIIMPNSYITQDAAPGEGSDGFYTPQFMGPVAMNGMYEANFMDIINFVENNYKVTADKEHRAIAGLSMGGFHSFHISRYYPNTFDYVGLFSSAFVPTKDDTGIVYSNIDETLQKQMDNGYKLYWIGIGKSDFLYKANLDFKQKLDDMGMEHIFMETEGGHTWRNWRIYLSKFATKIFKENNF